MSEVKDLYDGKYHLVNNEILKYLNKFFGRFSPLSIGGETPDGVDIEPPMEIVKTMETQYANCKCTMNLLDLNMKFHLLEVMDAETKRYTYIFYALELPTGIQAGQFSIGAIKAEILREALEYVWKTLMSSSKYNDIGIDSTDAYELHSIIDYIYYTKTVTSYGFDF